MRVRHDAEHAAQPPVAGEIPDDDLAVEAAGVERAAVGADRQAGDLRGALERLADRPAADVPDEHAVVLARRDGGAPVTAERRADDAPGVAPERRPRRARCRCRRTAPCRRGRRPPSSARPGSAPPSRRRRGCSAAGAACAHRGPRWDRRRRSSPRARPPGATISVTFVPERATAPRLADRPAAARRRSAGSSSTPTDGLSIVAISDRRSAENCHADDEPRIRRRAATSTVRPVAASMTIGCDPATASSEPSSLNRTTSTPERAPEEAGDPPPRRLPAPGGRIDAGAASRRCRGAPACARRG